MMYIILFASAAVLVSAHHEQTGQFRAIVKLAEPNGGEVNGNVTFTELTDGKVHIQGVIVGMPPGHYGFHIHEKGDITGGCLSTGSHYNPAHKDHGHPNDENRHVGDLGNIVFDENRVSTIDYVDGIISLTGQYPIIGRAVVLHAKADDFGRSSHPDSKKTGNAGGRVACGVIGILDPVSGWNKNMAATSTICTSGFAIVDIKILQQYGEHQATGTFASDVIILATCVLLVAVATFGCVGAAKENVKILCLYVGFLIIFVVLELLVAIFVSVQRYGLEFRISDWIRNDFYRNVTEDHLEQHQKLWDDIQTTV
ncbi:unnamed protein product [Parnassius apollo]|uniref:Superoxide dismutase [Cu-Zn] n=1 Tax=Parnassius apollo TaxID=110799 RepID=A0A8S3XC94_PARAO|nr:unnamed protein product [Parnassius apollo]